jgi:CRP-like cAMP-binding protein
MSEQGTLNALPTHPFLDNLPEQHRKLLAKAAQPFKAGPGEYLLKEGQEATTFYLIQAGHVSIDLHLSPQGVQTIQTLGPGDAVGWSWIVPPHRWQFDARAIEPVEGLRFDAAWLREQCEQDHTLGFAVLKEMLKVVASRLSASRLQRIDVYR